MNKSMRFRTFAREFLKAAAFLAIVASVGLVTSPDAHANDDQEISCLALTIYYEARGGSERGKLAVGYVVMNRTRSTLFPDRVCDVVQQGGQQRSRCQFSWWCDGRSDQPSDEATLREILKLAEEIYFGCKSDPTGGALWFHSIAGKPPWSKSLGPGKRIDRNVFYHGDSSRPAQINVATRTSYNCGRRSSPRPRSMTAPRSAS